jgi:exoribonuclease R
METYKVYISDRKYTSWEIFETATFQKVDIKINPNECKLFSNDVFSFDNNTVTIVHSTIRSSTPMPGVLVISGNKTYGRHKNGKLLYKCIPDDMRLPSFLVPYEIKHVGFSKVFINLYVTIDFFNWEDKHPHGRLSNVIGSVDILDNYYEYQLYCKSLNASIQKFQKDTSKAIEKSTHEDFIKGIKDKFPCIEDRTNSEQWHIFTIDPKNSLDFDDGFSICNIENDIQQLSIYISNVTVWMDVLNLWDSFSRRISTIYLPDKKRPMLPTILSDCLCSLQEKVTRIAFVMDVFIKDNDIIDVKFSNCFIKVVKNYCYEEEALLNNDKYKHLFDTTKKISKKFKYINNVRNSHEVVCYLMILMNYYCATEMIKYNTGIFRSTVMKRDFLVPDTVPEDVAKYIKIWNSASGQYVDGAKISIKRHELLDMEAYIHITSPIRRLVDLLNIIKLQKTINIITLSDNAYKFYDKWLNDLEYINITMRSIRKVQCDCTLLDLCANVPETMEKEYDGYVFDKINRNDGLYQYIVFLPELKLSSRITLRDNFENFENKKFKLYLFNDEESFKRKIRLQFIS